MSLPPPPSKPFFAPSRPPDLLHLGPQTYPPPPPVLPHIFSTWHTSFERSGGGSNSDPSPPIGTHLTFPLSIPRSFLVRKSFIHGGGAISTPFYHAQKSAVVGVDFGRWCSNFRPLLSPLSWPPPLFAAAKSKTKLAWFPKRKEREIVDI